MRTNKLIKGLGITLALTACMTAGFFAVSSGSVFGRYAEAEPYVTGEPEIVDDTVTPQSDTAIPLTSENEKLPEIPTTIGTKGKKTNPFVVLEIVPHPSERAISYLVSDPEEGLPYDPMELGITICDEYGKNMPAEYKNGSGNFNNFLSAKIGGVFNNNNHYELYTGEGEEEKSYDYTYIKKYYQVKTDSDTISDADFEKLTIKELAEKYETLFEEDKNGEKIRDIAIKDNRDWDRTKTKKEEYHYSITDYEKVSAEDYASLTLQELAEKYPTLFEDVKLKALKDNEAWKRSETTKTIQVQEESFVPDSGYFYNAGAGKGDYKMTSIWSPSFEKAEAGDKNQWIYVEKAADLPTGAYRIFDDKKDWQISGNLNDGSLLGGYFNVTDSEWTGKNVKVITQKYGTKDVPQYTFSYDKTEYEYEFVFYGMALRDILKRRLFFRDTNEEYDEFCIQVISLTPEEINEMDANDTAETLSYVERADMFYVAMFNAGDDNIKNHINFYRKYIAKEEGVTAGSDVTYHSYYENDLEWVDCMKIMKRLSANKNLPMLYENVVGDMVNQGVNEDGSTSNHIYLNENNTDIEQTGSLNNMAKLYLATVQMDLTKKTDGTDRTFKDHIYPYIRQIALTKQEGAGEWAPKYTGYFKRVDGISGNLCTCGQTTEYKERSYYLWGKAMFYPNAVVSELSELQTKYGYISNYVLGGDPSSFNNNKYNGGMNVAASTRGEDEKNVAVVYDNSANTNKTIFDNGGFNNMGRIAELILNNFSKDPNRLTITIRKNKREYTKLNDEIVLLDYEQKAKYRNDKTITLKCNAENTNNEDSIITKIEFVNEDTGETKTLIPNTQTAGTEEASPLVWEEITFSDGTKPVSGYRVNKNDSLDFTLPFSRRDWQKGYTVIHIYSVARCSYSRGKQQKYFSGDEKKTSITIAGRTLFNLE